MADAKARSAGELTMDELLEAHPGAVAILIDHGVDPASRCNHAVRHFLELRQILGRNCPVDDPAATLADLDAFLARTRKQG